MSNGPPCPPFLTPVEGGFELSVAVQPRASRSHVVGLHGGLLKIQLAAPPVDGEANRELVEVLADALKVKRADITILSGERGRKKKLRILGVDWRQAAALLLQ